MEIKNSEKLKITYQNRDENSHSGVNGLIVHVDVILEVAVDVAALGGYTAKAA